ncbi:MAG: hypothetical protein Q7T16_06810 [Candidatus Burarchaeum sp.]|nr:hypothetical protein [Candidatus Burarchaeum sp.]MDO8340339.1 hypothetical protein [Candidatus Burarchaeum sp.]
MEGSANSNKSSIQQKSGPGNRAVLPSFMRFHPLLNCPHEIRAKVNQQEINGIISDLVATYRYNNKTARNLALDDLKNICEIDGRLAEERESAQANANTNELGIFNVLRMDEKGIFKLLSSYISTIRKRSDNRRHAQLSALWEAMGDLRLEAAKAKEITTPSEWKNAIQDHKAAARFYEKSICHFITGNGCSPPEDLTNKLSEVQSAITDLQSQKEGWLLARYRY